MSFNRYDFSTLANGNNIAVIFGTNYNINISGTLTAIGTICGIAGGRDGLKYEVKNSTGYGVVLTENTSDPTPGNRFDMADGSDVVISDGGTAYIKYNASTSRWNVENIYPQGSDRYYGSVFASNAINWNVSSGYGAVSNLHKGILFGFASDYTSGTLTNLYAGNYAVDWMVSYSESAGSALIEYAVLTNGVEMTAGGHAFRDVSSTAYGVAASGCMLYLPANTSVQIGLEYITGSGGGIVTNANLRIHKL